MLTTKILDILVKWCFQDLFSYNPRKYIREKFLLSNPRKFFPYKLIRYTVQQIRVLKIICKTIVLAQNVTN